MNNRKTPRIRFKGFTDDWEQRKLGEMLISLQNNTLSRAELSPEQGIAKNVHYGDILVKFGEIIDVKTESLPMIADEAIMAKYKSSFLQNGDVIVADTAEDETVGKCTEIVGLSDEIVISGLHTIPYRPLQKFASGYLGYYMNSAFFHNQLLPLMQGIKVTSISKTALQNTDISYPKSENEQAAIGKYFSRLDHLITLHQRKLEKLKIVKKAMLENCFPKNGEKVPRFRFSGFTGDWEQRKLGEIFEEYSEKDHEELPALMIIQGYGTIRRDESERSLLYDKANLSNYKMVKEGDFIVHLRSFEGGLEMATNTGIISPAYHTFHGENTDSRFYYSYFRSKKFIDIDLTPHVYGIRDGRSIDIEGMKTVKIPFTSYEEQKAIGMFIKHLDHLITLHQRKLEKLKIIKKSFLEKMFV